MEQGESKGGGVGNRSSPGITGVEPETTLALRLVDKYGCWVSESTVYRTLRREGLVKRAEVKGFAAGKEYRRKTRRLNEMWATDGSYLRVVNWGYYYLVTVIDDYSHYIWPGNSREI